MGFPPLGVELAVHSRVLAEDPVASVDAFQLFVEPLATVLQHNPGCTPDEAHDSAIDALLAYLDAPAVFDPVRARLCTFLADIGRKRAIDRLRARRSREKREEEFHAVVELRSSTPKQEMETRIEVASLWSKVEQALPDNADRHALRLILDGERSTAVLAQALCLTSMAPDEQRGEVKRHRDRLLKALERLGDRLSDDQP
jgi:RNA polymerase sigma-70 factor (ECF subfamily)